MKQPVFFFAGHTNALRYAENALKRKGCCIVPVPDTSVTHLLLGVPSFEADGSVKGGGQLAEILSLFPQKPIIYGGNLTHPDLIGYPTVDLLKDPEYVAQNAQITAHCAAKLAMEKLPLTLQHCPVLVIGWGRIGKCLAHLLKNMGARVSVAARKESDRALLTALGYDAIDTVGLCNSLARYRVLFNTAPTLLLSTEEMELCPTDCLKIDLASCPGMEAPDVIWARGLPNKDAPEASGELIAQTVLRLL